MDPSSDVLTGTFALVVTDASRGLARPLRLATPIDRPVTLMTTFFERAAADGRAIFSGAGPVYAGPSGCQLFFADCRQFTANPVQSTDGRFESHSAPDHRLVAVSLVVQRGATGNRTSDPGR